ncbi:MAG: inorganic phosphate transporter [Gemmatimonadota bacterium]
MLAKKVTPMDHHEGFVANLVTAGLVTAGAVYGLPMSTTHVSSGGIFSAGARRGTLNRKTLRDILLAWVITLPAAAALGMAVYAIAGWVQGGAS